MNTYRATVTIFLVMMVICTVTMAQTSSNNCTFNTPNGTVNLANIAPTSLVMNQKFNNQVTAYQFQMTACAPTITPMDSKLKPCNHAGYVSEYDYTSGGCLTAWGTVINFWHYDEASGAFLATFQNERGWLAKMSVSCGPWTGFTPVGNTVNVSSDLTFHFAFTAFGACPVANTPVPNPNPTLSPPVTVAPPPPPSTCSVLTPSGAKNLDVGTATLDIEQRFQGQGSMYTWVINLCNAVNQPPAGSAGCTEAGFISEFNPTGCLTSWSTPVSPWTYDSDKRLAVASFRNDKGWKAEVFVGCGRQQGLAAAGDVSVSHDLTFTFLLATAAMCDDTPTQPPTPITNPPSNATCSVSLPSGPVNLGSFGVTTLDINQLYQGYSTPYTWVFSLCNPVSQPPVGLPACNNGAGFITEYGNSACESAWNTQIQDWQYNEAAQVVSAAFMNGKGWTAIVTVGCGPQPTLAADGDVLVTMNDNSSGFTFTFKLTSSAFCSAEGRKLLDKVKA